VQEAAGSGRGSGSSEGASDGGSSAIQVRLAPLACVRSAGVLAYPIKADTWDEGDTKHECTVYIYVCISYNICYLCTPWPYIIATSSPPHSHIIATP
jgi:hypothetical protein